MIFHLMEQLSVNSVHSVTVVGDTPLDLQAGANAGVKFNIGVLSGAASRERLEQEPHTHIIQSIALLPEVLTEGAHNKCHHHSHSHGVAN
jgi:phosphoglycolate phosphatase-like HAD superfamily hydrolase